MKPNSPIVYSTDRGTSAQSDRVTLADKFVALVNADNLARANVNVTGLLRTIVVAAS
jgi:hypothetical protein